MDHLVQARPREHQLRRHPLWLARPFATGAALMGACAGLAAAYPALVHRADARLAFAIVELLCFWCFVLLPFLEWRMFRFRIEDDWIEVREFRVGGMLLRSYPSIGTILICEQPFWLLPFNVGTIVLRTGETTLRYTMLTPIAG